MKTFTIPTVALVLLGVSCGTPSRAFGADAAKSDPATLSLTLRKRVETTPGSGRFHTIVQPAKWDAKKTAIIVCDMWDLHHCLNAVRRAGEMAPRMNRLLSEARTHGVLIIHAPSSCMAAYKDHPARRNALKTPRAKNVPKDIAGWCKSIPAEEKGVYPIDQSDGGEDDDLAEHRAWAAKLEKMGRNPRAPWKSQLDVLKIEDRDVISDNGEEIWSVLDQRGIDNVVLLGVHTNMCVLGRPFGLRQMARHGKNVVLMRDLTDTMYNPARAPFVSHFTGTDLIVEHIEKWVCPTITSDQFLGDKPFRFSGDKRPHLVMLLAEYEYQTNRTLPEFAHKHLGKDFRVSTVFGNEKKNANDLPGIEALNDADIVLISMRRRALPEKQMEIVRQFVSRGKPVVGIRTASHAFSLRGSKPPEGCATWEAFDAEVFGGHYTNHHGVGPKVDIKAAEKAADHPILQGVHLAELHGNGSLYQVRPLAKSTTAILIGSIPDKPAEPILWTNATKAGGRVVYTSLGHPDDFKEAAFNRLLSNALHWAAGLPTTERRPISR
ncbi:MAG TPA: ThuA domain-containing protein [Gemmataceae bacterium]|nr:ThuA domain-containing protein [Gemmataceae bacterium]